MTIGQLKNAIKTAEKLRGEWQGIGDIPVTYEALCDLRNELTDRLISKDQEASAQHQRDLEYMRMCSRTGRNIT